MIYRSALIWLASCLVMGCGSNTPDTPAGGSATGSTAGANRQKGDGFTLEVPAGWTVFAPPGSFTIYPEGGSGDASMTISLVAYPPERNPESYLAERKEMAPRQTGTIEAAEVTVGGLPGLKHVYAFDPAKSAAADNIQYEVAAAKGSYKIFCAVTKPDEFSKYQQVFEQVIQSIRFE